MSLRFSFMIAFLLHVTFAEAAPVTIVPFVVEKNCIYFYCRVNDTDSVKFLFDTGASVSVINTHSAKVKPEVSGSALNTGSNGNNSVDESKANRVQLGTLTRKDVTFLLIDFDTDLIDGVFGYDLMKGNVIEIDYQKLELRFYANDDTTIDFSGYQKNRLRLIDDYPAVESTLVFNGRKLKGLFGLDSGADDALTIASPFAVKHQLKGRASQIGSATFAGSDGSVYEMPIVLCNVVAFSGKELYNVPSALSTSTEGIDATEKMAGFYGNNFLKRFNTIIDFQKGNIYFKLNANLYSPF